MSRGDRDLVKEGLKDRIEDWLRRLLPDGRREGRLLGGAQSAHRRRGDASEESRAEGRPRWRSRRLACYRSGDKGDVIRLAEHCLGLDFRQAMDFARDFLGMRAMTPGSVRTSRPKNREAQGDGRENGRGNAAEASQGRAAPLERRGQPVRETRRRRWRGGISPRGAAFPSRPCGMSTARLSVCIPRWKWWEGAQWSTRERPPGETPVRPELSAIVCGFRSPTGVVTGVHCTFLDPARPAKAPVKTPKLMFGDTRAA